MHWSEVWYGEAPGAAVARALLTPVSWLYSAGWTAYLATYRLGLKKPKEPHRPVVCVGNLTVGGSGKTPLTLHVAEVLKQLGKQVVVSCSGYGSPRAEAASVAPEGELSASEWGDEPAMIRWLAPDIPLIVGRRRVLAAELCHKQFPGAVMLMDDGFQHMPLEKHVTILLDPPTPNHRCLPAGPYREPAKNRNRADLVIPSEMEMLSEFSGIFLPNGEELALPNQPVNVLCALGRPHNFLRTLEQAGLQLGTTLLKPDHDPLSEGNLFEALPPEQPVVVTAKDWVKLRERSDLEGRRIWIARQQVRVVPASVFREWLEHKLHAL